MSVNGRIERLENLIDKLAEIPRYKFSNFILYKNGRIQLNDNKECAVRGCYLIYQKGKGLPIYIGSNRSQKRKVRGRIRSIFYGRGHPLPYKIVKDLFYKRSKIKVTTKEVQRNIEEYRKWCFKNLSFKILEEKNRPLAMEIGLIYLFRPKYNSESKKFSD